MQKRFFELRLRLSGDCQMCAVKTPAKAGIGSRMGSEEREGLVE